MQAFFDDYVRLAGLATELVNTAPGVWHGEDQLSDSAALTGFLAEHGIDAEPATRDLDAVRDLRTRLREVLDARDAEVIASGASELAARGLGTVGLAPDAQGRQQWCARSRPDAALADHLALLAGVGVLGALRTLGPERFRDCASDTCSGVFIDTTRPGRRRYCMPDLCGNRANVAAYRARRRANS